MCKYCEKFDDTIFKSVAFGEFFMASKGNRSFTGLVRYPDGKIVLEDAEGIDIDVNFCPICGLKLNNNSIYCDIEAFINHL